MTQVLEESHTSIIPTSDISDMKKSTLYVTLDVVGMSIVPK